MRSQQRASALATLMLVAAAGAPCNEVDSAPLFDLGERYFESFQELEPVQPNAIVLDIQQDAQGFIWLATTKALLRYDGYDFKEYVNDESDPGSISGNFVQAIRFVGDHMWVGTYSDGVSVYDPMTDRFTRLQHDPSDLASLLSNDVRALSGTDEIVVIATRSGINLFDVATGQLSTLGHVEGCAEMLALGKLTALAIDGKALFIGSSHGVCQLGITSQALTDERLVGERLAALDEQKVFNLDIMPDGTVWVATSDNGVAVLDRGSQLVRWIPVDEHSAAALHHPWVDDTTLIDGRVWVATAGGGIAIVNPQTLVVEEHIVSQLANPSGLSSDDVSAIFVNETGIVWIGTYGRGMNRYNPASRPFRILRQNPLDPATLADPDIRSVLQLRDGDLWLGTLTSGVQVVRSGVGLVKTYAPTPGEPGALQNGYVTALAQLPNGDLWLGTGQSGVYRYNASSDDFTQYTRAHGLADDAVRVLYAADDATLWVGTEAGLSRYDPSADAFVAVDAAGQSSLPFDRAVWSIVAHRGQLWVGTNRGLFLLAQGASELVQITSDPAKPLTDNFIKGLFIDSQERLWVVTAQGTDILTAFKDSAASFQSVEALLGNTISLQASNLEEDLLGRIWAQAAVIDPSEWSYSVVRRSAGWDNGGQWAGSHARSDDGTLLFGGMRGLLMVRPEQYRPRHYEPTLTITGAQVDSRPVSPDRLAPLSLEPSAKSFTVEFSSLNYSGSEPVRYEYMLEGYDDRWISTTAKNRRATYSRLAPGAYRLRIRATNRAGSVSEAAVAVKQFPAWYETTPFRALVVLLALGLLYLLYRARVAHLERQKRALDQLVEERTRNIRQLAQAGKDIASSLDLEEVLHAVYTRVGEFMDTTVFVIGSMKDDERSVSTLLHYEEGKQAREFSIDLSDGQSPAAWCISNRQALIVSDEEELRVASQELRFIDRPQAVQSAVFYPLMSGDRIRGFLSLQSYKRSAYGANELEMLKTIATYAAVAIENAESHSQLNRARAEMERASLKDQLTGLHNRRFLDNFLPSEVSRLRRLVAEGSRERLGLLLIDVDHFKKVNDTYGHHAGDKVLVQLAQMLRAIIRDSDWAVRLGGEEFLVLARVTAHSQLLQLAERVRVGVETHRFELKEHGTIRNTCSIGVSQFPFVASSPSAMTWEQSLNLADRALYRAKSSGRNTWIALLEKQVRAPEVVYEAAITDLQALVDGGQITLESSSSFRPHEPVPTYSVAD